MTCVTPFFTSQAISTLVQGRNLIQVLCTRCFAQPGVHLRTVKQFPPSIIMGHRLAKPDRPALDATTRLQTVRLAAVEQSYRENGVTVWKTVASADGDKIQTGCE